MRKSLVLICSVTAALLLAPSANAAVTSVFNDEDTPLTCAVAGPNNYRYCGDQPGASTVESFDGTPIDVFVALPADPGTVETQRPVVGLFHGWAGSKINLRTDQTAQALLAQGFIVFTMTDRGWANSCGGPSVPIGASVKASPCEKGYIHLMHNAYEVRDAQTVLGKLAEDKEDTDANFLIDSTKIGAAGGSYGGGISAALGMLKDRVQLADGTLTAWESPDSERPMAIAAAAPQYTWSDLASALMPNGSTLDYASANPYLGPDGDRRVGTLKDSWVFKLYASGLQAGYYGPAGAIGPGYPDPAANMIGWYTLLSSGGPYDGNASVNSVLNELTTNHSSYYIPIDATDHQPAPMLISAGWNDDLFPVSESVKLYNKIRATSPSTPVAIWGADIGHPTRSNGSNAALLADATPLIGTQVTWMVRYLKGLPAPWPVPGFSPAGGAVATSSKCDSAQARVAGDISVASSWNALAAGEVSFGDDDARTIGNNTTPTDAFQDDTAIVCKFASNTLAPAGSAAWRSAPAQAGGYTLAGSATVEATMTVNGANDQVVARLYDYDPDAGKQRLIARGIYRPVGVGDGATKQTFQLYPQNYKIDEGHRVRLELLSKDAPYAMSAKNVSQKSIQVSGLKISLPVKESPSGQITLPTPKTLPAGYTFSADALATDTTAPKSSDNVPTETSTNESFTVTLSASDQGISGVKEIRYEVGANPAATIASPIYDPNNKPVLTSGQRINYMSVDNAGNTEAAHDSPTFVVERPLALSLKISGKVKVGKKIKVVPTATFLGAKQSGVTFTYKWTVKGKKAGTKSSLKLSKKWKGKKILVTVIASKSGYEPTKATKTVTKKLKK